MRIVHISDLHFPTRLNPVSLRRKSLIGYANYAFRRRKKHLLHEKLINYIQKLEYDCLVISGDITNVSAEKEFVEARRILSPVLDERTFIIPGNHDRYTIQSLEKKLFENTFGEFSGNLLTSNEGSGVYLRRKEISGVNFFGWDSNLPLPAMQAQGYLDPDIVKKTYAFLNESKIQDYMVVCHHPIWNPVHRQESDRHRLLNRDDILAVLRDRPPIAYFHGHLHTNWVRLPGGNIPFFVVNSASSTRSSDGRHDSGFHVMTKTGSKEWEVERYYYNSDVDDFRLTEPILYKD